MGMEIPDEVFGKGKQNQTACKICIVCVSSLTSVLVWEDSGFFIYHAPETKHNYYGLQFPILALLSVR